MKFELKSYVIIIVFFIWNCPYCRLVQNKSNAFANELKLMSNEKHYSQKQHKSLDFRLSFYNRYKKYMDEYKGGYYASTGCDIVTQNGLIYHGKINIDPLFKIIYLEGEGPLKRNGDSPWYESYFRIAGGICVTNFLARGVRLKLSLGKHEGDKETTVPEAELYQYTKFGKLPIGFDLLVNKEIEDDANFFRGRIESDFIRYKKIRIGIGFETERWSKEDTSFKE